MYARISNGEWRPGQAIPSETELAETFSAAVGTVRKALDALVLDGLLVREQGRGTFVRRPNFDHSLFRFFRHQGKGGNRVIPDSRILERESLPGPSEVTTALHLLPETRVVRLSRLRLFEGIPTLLEEIWLPFDRFGLLLDMPVENIATLLYPFYERCFGEVVACAEETLTIGAARQPEMEHLGLAPTEAVVVVERLALGYDGRPIEWRQTRGAARTFRYHVVMR